MALASKLLLACVRSESRSGGGGDLSPRPHYPSMPKYPKEMMMESPGSSSAVESLMEARALFSVIGMTCSACAGSVEKAVKRLSGIKEAVVDVLNNRARVSFFPNIVIVS